MSDVLAGAGLLIVAAASAAAILLPPGRRRSVAMALAMLLFPVLIVGDQWHTAQITDLRHDETRIVGLLAIAAIAIATLAYLFRRWPTLLPLSIVFALPFRIPLEAGGDKANLLVPLYLVIAAGVVVTVLRDWQAPEGPWSARRLAWLLAAFVALYALQTLYSEDFSKGLQNVCFFLVPFTITYRLLREVEWNRRLLTLVLVLLGIEASAFVLIGTVELATRSLFWNDQVIRSNEFHTYFRVNSVFWDPNVYGRYLALVATVVAAAMLWARDRRSFALLTILLGVLWFGLVQSFSQSSYIALLAGLAMLAAIRWNPRWTLAAVAVGSVGAFFIVVLTGGKFDLGRINIDTSGRANLVSGGVELFGERPLWGYGSGSFQAAYREHQAEQDVPVSESHTEPVTVLAEQGLIGFVLYVSLIVVALWTMGSGLWARPPPASIAARAAVIAAFVALLVHTLAYAGFFEDPTTWVLLAIGASLAAAPAVRPAVAADPAVRDPA